MKILIVGASGVLGSHVKKHLENQHEIITASKNNGDVNMDMSDVNSIQSAFDKIGSIDAVICTAGQMSFNHFAEMSLEEWQIGLNSKLMGQIMLAKIATQHLNTGGSITLTSGVISQYPLASGISATTINGGIEHFVSAAANELRDEQRINVVSPSVIEESWHVYGDYFTGYIPVPVLKVVKAYERSTTGIMSGKTICVFE